MNKISRSSSKGKKRQRRELDDDDAEEKQIGPEPTDADQTPSLEESLTFSDTMAALRIMRAQFPHIDKSLKREKLLRIFKLNTGQDDHAIMFLEDYLNQIERLVKRMEEKNQGDLQVFEWFKTHVIGSRLEPSIDHQELCLLLSHGGKVKDEHISILINAGLLTRQLIDPNMYWFAIPNIISILKGLSQHWFIPYLFEMTIVQKKSQNSAFLPGSVSSSTGSAPPSHQSVRWIQANYI